MAYVGVDAGGTSWKVVLADAADSITARTSIPTAKPEVTIGALANWISEQQRDGHVIEAVGLSCFGPIDRDPLSPNYGLVGETTKPGWSGVNPRAEVERLTGISCVLDSDVNGALLAEIEWGAARGLTDAAYITVGTGVGGAALVNGNLVGAPFHGEFGHIRPPRTGAEIEAFKGACPFHGDCVEGLASASAIRARWNREPHELDDDHEAWDVVASALAGLCQAITYLLAPQRIILGGGILQRPMLIGRIRDAFVQQTNDFGARPEPKEPETYISLPDLRDDAGALGGLFLAMKVRN